MDLDPARAALLTIDLQNDFLHPRGAYGRAGQTAGAIAALPERIAPVVAAARARGIPYVSAQFTLVPGPGGAPLIAPHLAALRPFLGPGDFAPGAWGHALVDALAPADYVIEKVAYSALHQTRLLHVLRHLGRDTLLIGGIVTNGGVASTVRDCHLHELSTVVLSDGCAAFRPEVHEATLLSLASLGPQLSCADVSDILGS
jgi:nicotinamidase-related amidase